MPITIHFIVTSLPNRLATVRDALLRKHPSELTINVLESALKDIESNLRSVATASGTVVLPLFQGFTVPQLPTFTTSLASTASHASDETAAVSTTGGWPSGKGHKRGGKGGGGGGGGGGGDTRLCNTGCLVMEIARTSMIHARAPHIRWPYAVCYAAHQLNLWPRVSWPEASPTSLWTGSLGVASEFRVWGCLALVRDTSADKLSAGALPCVFLGIPMGSSDFSFYHLPLHRVSFTTPPPSIAHQVPPPSPTFILTVTAAAFGTTRQVAVDYEGVGVGGTLEVLLLKVLELGVLALEVLVRGVLQLEVLDLELLELEVLDLEVLALEVVAHEPTPLAVHHMLTTPVLDEPLNLMSSAEAEIYAGAMAAQELCWFSLQLGLVEVGPRVLLCGDLHSVTRDDVSLFEHMSGSLQAPKAPAELVADAGEEVRTQFCAIHIAFKWWMARDAATTLAVRLHLSFDQRANFRQVSSAHALCSAVGGDAGGAGSGCAAFGGARSPLVGGVGGTSAGGAGAGGAGSGGALQSLPRRPIFLEQLSSSLLESTPTCTIPLLFPPPDSPLPAPARYVPLSVSLTRRWEPVSCAASSAPSRVTREPVVLPLPRPSSLPAVPDPVSDLARATRLTILCCLAALVTAPASSPAAACALVAELAVFAATCRHAYLVGLVSASSCPPSVGGELALDYDVFEDMQFKLEYLPYPLSIWTRYVAPGRHHPVHWRVARRVLRYLVRLASIK
ncbi:unnamed protein product [Closterium sp. NIES-53]